MTNRHHILKLWLCKRQHYDNEKLRAEKKKKSVSLILQEKILEKYLSGSPADSSLPRHYTGRILSVTIIFQLSKAARVCEFRGRGGTKATQFVWAVLVLGVATAVHSLPPARGQPAVHTRSRTAWWSRVRVKGSLSSKHWGCRLRSPTAATDWRCRQRGRWPLRAHLPHCCKSLPPAEATRLGFKGPMFLFFPHFLLSGTRI